MTLPGTEWGLGGEGKAVQEDCGGAEFRPHGCRLHPACVCAGSARELTELGSQWQETLKDRRAVTYPRRGSFLQAFAEQSGSLGASSFSDGVPSLHSSGPTSGQLSQAQRPFLHETRLCLTLEHTQHAGPLFHVGPLSMEFQSPKAF